MNDIDVHNAPRVMLTRRTCVDPVTHALTLLGTLPVEGTSGAAPAILRIEKTALSVDAADQIVAKFLESTKLIEGTDIVSSLHWYPCVDDTENRGLTVHMDVRVARKVDGQSRREDQYRPSCNRGSHSQSTLKYGTVLDNAYILTTRQYSRQEVAIVHETPELYERIVKPYITAFPPSRTQWHVSLLTRPRLLYPHSTMLDPAPSG